MGGSNVKCDVMIYVDDEFKNFAKLCVFYGLGYACTFMVDNSQLFNKHNFPSDHI